MQFAINCILAGIVCAVVGLWWLVDGLVGGLLSQVIDGLVWKGPLLSLGGSVLSFLGFRMLRAHDEANKWWVAFVGLALIALALLSTWRAVR